MLKKVKQSSIEKIDSRKTFIPHPSIDFHLLFSSAIDTHDITLGHYLRDAPHLESLRQRCALVPEINSSLLERNTALQVR